jgi:hypothetical protein
LRYRHCGYRLPRRQRLFVARCRAHFYFEPVLLAIEYLTEIQIRREQAARGHQDRLLDWRADDIAARDCIPKRERELIGLAIRQRTAVIELTLIGKRRGLRGNGLRIHRCCRHQRGSTEHAKLFAFHDQQSSKPLKKSSSIPVVGAADQNPATRDSVNPLE